MGDNIKRTAAVNAAWEALREELPEDLIIVLSVHRGNLAGDWQMAHPKLGDGNELSKFFEDFARTMKLRGK